MVGVTMKTGNGYTFEPYGKNCESNIYFVYAVEQMT